MNTEHVDVGLARFSDWAFTSSVVVLVAAFTLRALKQAFFGDKDAEGEVRKVTTATTLSRDEFDPITVAEKIGASMLMVATLAVGVYPKLLLDRIMPAVEAMRFLK